MDLDNLNQIQKLDSKKVSSSIDSLPDQIRQAWSEVSKITLSSDFANTRNVVVAGMGGSALGGRICQYLFADQTRGPIEVCTQYKLPNYVNQNSLVILYSYSGNTEETLSAANQALEKGAQIFVVATGGHLNEFLKKYNLAGYIFKPNANPSNQPRMSLGYAVTIIMAVLSKCGFISIDDVQINELVENTTKFVEEFNVRVPRDKNFAKLLATKLVNKSPVLVSSEHLWGVSHAVKNQFNENAKTFTTIFDIPELNHHLIEGLQFPKFTSQFLHFVFFRSELYSPRLEKVYQIIQEIVEKNKYSCSLYNLQSKSKVAQAFELLTFGSYVGFYLSLLNEIDPAPIPWVDYLKKQMSS